MNDFEQPAAVTRAVHALWTWLGFLCLSGIYEGWIGAPQVQAAIPPELGISFSRGNLFLAIASGYILIAATMIGVVIKAGRGKKWALITLILSFALDLVVNVFSPPDGVIEYISSAIDLSLQAYALTMLCSKSGREWFRIQADNA